MHQKAMPGIAGFVMGFVFYKLTMTLVQQRLIDSPVIPYPYPVYNTDFGDLWKNTYLSRFNEDFLQIENV